MKRDLKQSRDNLLQVIFGRTTVIILLLLIQFLFFFLFIAYAEKYIPYVFGSTTVLAGIMLIFILNTKENPSFKLSWFFFIAVLPLFGTLMYLFTRVDVGHRIEQKAVTKTIEETKNMLSADEQLEEQLKNTDRRFYNLSCYLKRAGNFYTYKNCGMEYFSLGENKWQALLTELEKAEKFIFIEYFIIKDGQMWRSILDILKKKAEAGVEVRVLYDGTNAVTNLPYGYPKQLKKLGIKCKMFSPLRPLVSTQYNNRDHRKIVVIDGLVAFTGGINIGDEYVNITHPYGHWKDTGVEVRGEAVNQFTVMFLQMWNYDVRHRDYGDFIVHDQLTPCGGLVIPYCDNPMDDENVAKNVYLDIINGAKDHVYIMSPYLILDSELIFALTFAAKRGVDVKLIFPSVPDHVYAYVLALDHFPALLEAGVKIYLYNPGFVHAKEFLSDNEIAVTGTINLDYRSLYHHFECAMLMYKTPQIKDIAQDFDSTLKECTPVTAETLKKRSMFSRIASFILKVAAPLM